VVNMCVCVHSRTCSYLSVLLWARVRSVLTGAYRTFVLPGCALQVRAWSDDAAAAGMLLSQHVAIWKGAVSTY
jgi:hypothetical protein